MFPTTSVNFPVNISLSPPHFCNCHFTSLLLLISVIFLLCDTFLWQGVLPGSLGGRIQGQRYQEFEFFFWIYPVSWKLQYLDVITCVFKSAQVKWNLQGLSRDISVFEGACGNQAFTFCTNITVGSVLEQCCFCTFFRSIFCKSMNFALCLTFLFLSRVYKFIWPVISDACMTEMMWSVTHSSVSGFE